MVDLIDAVEADAQVAPSPTPDAPSGLRGQPAAARRTLASGSHASGVRYAPLLLVAFAVGFGLWLLRPELRSRCRSRTTPRRTRRSRASPSSGSGPATARSTPGTRTSGWVRRSSSSTRRCRTSSPRLLSIVFGGSVFRWANYLLICTWPISVYIGARLLGLDRWQAGAAGAPLADALERRRLRLRVGQLRLARQRHVVDAVGALAHADRVRGWRGARSAKGERYALAAFVVGLTCAFHFIAGYFVLLALGVFVLVHPPADPEAARPQRARGRGRPARSSRSSSCRRSAASTTSTSTRSRPARSGSNSYGPGKVFTWLFDGRIFDSGRHPVVTVLVGIGALVCLVAGAPRRSGAGAARADGPRPGAVLGAPRGRVRCSTGLPGGSDLLLHRYIIGVHFAGMLLGGIGSVWAFRAVVTAARASCSGSPVADVVAVAGRVRARRARDVAGARTTASATPATTARTSRRRYRPTTLPGAEVNRADRHREAARRRTRLRGPAEQLGRVPRKVGQVALLELLVQRDADSLGFTLRTDSLSQDIESYFNENNPAQYDLFNVKYVLDPPGRQPAGAGDADRASAAGTRSGRSRTSAATSRSSTRPNR